MKKDESKDQGTGVNLSFWIPFVLIAVWCYWMKSSTSGDDTLINILFVIALVIDWIICRLLAPIFSGIASMSRGVKGLKEANKLDSGTGIAAPRDTVQEKHGDTGKARSMEWRRIRITLLSIVLYIVAILLGIVSLSSGLTAGLVVGAISLTVVHVVTGAMRSSLNNDVKEHFALDILNEFFKVDKYDPDARVDESDILKVFQNKGEKLEVEGDDYVEASRGGVTFVRSDLRVICVEERMSWDEDSPHTDTVRTDLFSGFVLRAEHNRSADVLVTVCTEGTPNLKAHSKDRINVNFGEINQRLNAFCPDHEGALKILTPEVVQGMTAIARAANGRVIQFMTLEYYYLLVATERDYFDLDSKISIAENAKMMHRQAQHTAEIVDQLSFLKI